MALCLLGVVCFFGLVADVRRKKASVVTIISAVVFSLLLPFAMDGARLLNSSVHVLMMYACWLSYVFIYVLLSDLRRLQKGNGQNIWNV